MDCIKSSVRNVNPIANIAGTVRPEYSVAK